MAVQAIEIVRCGSCSDCGACHEHKDAAVFCGRCAGTGAFITCVENGVPKGPGGMCFRCRGKGYHTKEDRRRNDYFDRHRTF